MKLVSYKGTQARFRGLGNVLTRMRLRGPYSHCEIMFEPGDGVDHLMPDRTCEPDVNGAYWCLSATAAEELPMNSTRRPGRKGGVRFKRISLDDSKWSKVDLKNCNPHEAASLGKIYQGFMYDWQMILGFVAWVIPHKQNRFTCSEFCAMAMQIGEPERFDPCNLHEVAVRFSR